MATSAYQCSKRLSVYLSMTDEVDTTPILHVSLFSCEKIVTSHDLAGYLKLQQVRCLLHMQLE